VVINRGAGMLIWPTLLRSYPASARLRAALRQANMRLPDPGDPALIQSRLSECVSERPRRPPRHRTAEACRACAGGYEALMTTNPDAALRPLLQGSVNFAATKVG
jgi:hypothetical protein